MFSQIGVPGVIILIIICIIAFGAKNLPTIGRSVGESFREFKYAIHGKTNESSSNDDTLANKKEDI